MKPRVIAPIQAKSEKMRVTGPFIFDRSTDWSQNDDHKTTVSVYSLRARAFPSVSTPVTWREVATCAKQGKSQLLSFQAQDVVARAKQQDDLFSPVLKLKQKLLVLR